MRVRIQIAAIAVYLIATIQAFAAPCPAAHKPNGDLATAESVAAEFCRSGQASDDQSRDLFRWTVAPGDAANLWSFALQALPGQSARLEFFELVPGANTQDIAKAPLRFAAETAPGSTSLTIPPLLLHPGSYILAVSGIGGKVLYRLRTQTAGSLPATSSGTQKDGFLFSLTAGDHPTEIPWQLSANGAANRWTIALQLPPGTQLPVTLRDAKGDDLLVSSTADAQGVERLPDLGLKAGSYRIILGPLAGTPLMLSATADGARAADFAEEPDNDVAHAHALAVDTTVHGRLIAMASEVDTDFFRVDVDQTLAGKPIDFNFRTEGAGNVSLDLLDANEQPLAAMAGNRDVRLAGMTLKPGRYFIRVRGALGASQNYTLDAQAGAVQEANLAIEPNNTPAQATHVIAGQTISGSLSSSDTRDYLSVDVKSGLELWNLEVLGTGVSRVVLYGGAGNELTHASPAAGSSVLKLSRVLLAQGSHVILIEGDRGSWLFRAQNLGAPKPGDEIEPNDTIANAMPLEPGIEHRGWLDHGGDLDQYSFYLPAEHRITLTLTAPADFPVSANLDWGDRGDHFAHFVTAAGADGVQHAVWHGLLPPGDYLLRLAADNGGASDYPYTLRIDPAPYFQPATDTEPNDRPWQARPLPPDLKLDGDLTEGDNDWFQLPAQSASTTLTIEASALPAGGLDILVARPRVGGSANEFDKVGEVSLNAKSGPQSLTVPGATPLLLRLQGGSGAYHLALSLSGKPAIVLAPTAVNATLSFATAKVAAYLPRSQEVQGKLHLHSNAQSAMTLRTKYWIGDVDWSLSGLPQQIAISPGSDLDVPVVLHVGSDARDDWPIETHIALWADGALPAMARARIEPAIGVTPVAPGTAAIAPAAVRGGLDVAWSALGAKTDTPHAGLIDGAVDATATPLTLGQPVTIQLAGGSAHRIAGVSLTPPPASQPSERLRDFRIAVSEDGSHYKTVLEGRLWPLAHEQYYLFSPQQPARFVEITAISRQGEPDSNKALLAQLKVIADPAELPEGNAAFDLARPELGGHVVWTSPQPNSPVTGDGLLWPGKGPVTFRSDPKEATAPVEWVTAFRSDRTAVVDELTWRERTDVPAAERIQSVDIAIGTVSPVGPWTALGSWPLRAGPDGSAHFKLPPASAVKYVHYRVTAPASGRITFPDRLGATEQAVSATYRSILGEWGGESNQAGTVPSDSSLAQATSSVVAAHDRSAATPLAAETIARGVVQLGQSSDWYRIQLPAPTRQLMMQITGDPAPEAVVRVEDSKGSVLAMTPVPDAPGRYSAPAVAGTYFMQVSQPPRSVVVAWDTSNSVARFAEGIERVVQRLSLDIVPGLEEVNLVPFRGNESVLLLDPWGATAADVYGTLSSYQWTDNSSDPEDALIVANRAFATRPGTHAVAVITDGEGSSAERTAVLWKGMAIARPRVFALKVPSADGPAAVRAQMNLMEDWAYSSGGFYDLFASQGDADVEFRRMAAWLRQPASYGLSYSIGTAPPPPGTLAVAWAAAAQAADAPGPAIAILIDASGSMLQRIGGKPKIEIEKQLLHDLVTKTLPAKTPLMIRVFGQGGRGSCRSDLVAPLAPLDPARISPVIAKIQSTNGAKTAIGDSLRLISQDMAGVKGPRQVVLITDGGEDCGGNPEAEIQKLRAAGFDVRINIVGFAVDEPQTRVLFQKWATLGGGHFFDSSDRASLDTALSQAFAQPFEVVAPDGKVVAQGVVGGDAITLPAGLYTVRLSGANAKSLGSVQVAPGETTRFDVAP